MEKISTGDRNMMEYHPTCRQAQTCNRIKIKPSMKE